MVKKIKLFFVFSFLLCFSASSSSEQDPFATKQVTIQTEDDMDEDRKRAQLRNALRGSYLVQQNGPMEARLNEGVRRELAIYCADTVRYLPSSIQSFWRPNPPPASQIEGQFKDCVNKIVAKHNTLSQFFAGPIHSVYVPEKRRAESKDSYIKLDSRIGKILRSSGMIVRFRKVIGLYVFV